MGIEHQALSLDELRLWLNDRGGKTVKVMITVGDDGRLLLSYEGELRHALALEYDPEELSALTEVDLQNSAAGYAIGGMIFDAMALSGGFAITGDVDGLVAVLAGHEDVLLKIAVESDES